MLFLQDYFYVQYRYKWSLNTSPAQFLKQIKPVCPVHNLRAGYAVPYHSFHTQSACHCHVTSGDGWGWTSSWRLWGTGHTCTPSPLCGLSCVGQDFIRRAQANQWFQTIIQITFVTQSVYIYQQFLLTHPCTCTHLGRSSHSLCTRGQARRCPRVPVWSLLSVCQRWSRCWSMNTSGAAAAQA